MYVCTSVFAAAWFMIAKNLQQPKSVSTGWVNYGIPIHWDAATMKKIISYIKIVQDKLYGLCTACFWVLFSKAVYMSICGSLEMQKIYPERIRKWQQ